MLLPPDLRDWVPKSDSGPLLGNSFCRPPWMAVRKAGKVGVQEDVAERRMKEHRDDLSFPKPDHPPHGLLGWLPVTPDRLGSAQGREVKGPDWRQNDC